MPPHPKQYARHWFTALPFASLAVLAAAWNTTPGAMMLLAIGLALVSAVLTAVHHAEVVAHRVGEPFGTLVLALAVTVIEVALVVSMMLSGGDAAKTIARDTVFAAIMIVINGVIGVCLLLGAARHSVIAFRVEGTSPALTVLVALAVLVLVLPSFTTTTAGPTFSASQLAFAGAMSFILYAAFVFVQTVRHRDYFLPFDTTDDEAHAAPPSNRATWGSLALLLICLVSVVGLAKTLAPTIQSVVASAGAPAAVVGIAIAMLVLLPETIAAARNARANRMQTSLNLALGSALATIGLTIPVVALISVTFDLPLTLGLSAKDMVLLTLSLLIAIVTLGNGRATVLQGTVHLVLFAVFLFLAVVP